MVINENKRKHVVMIIVSKFVDKLRLEFRKHILNQKAHIIEFDGLRRPWTIPLIYLCRNPYNCFLGLNVSTVV